MVRSCESVVVYTKGSQRAHLAGASGAHYYHAKFAHGCVGGYGESLDIKVKRREYNGRLRV